MSEWQRDTPYVIVHPDKDTLAAAVAARLLTAIVDLQAARRTPRIGLTGGGVGIALLEQLRDNPGRDAIDWGNVEFWWGDERFLPAGDAERNEVQARAALLDHVPVDEAKVFAMAADEGQGADAGAAAYPAVPRLDVLMLGMGGEGHTASIFPDSPAVHVAEAAVVPVYDCPKPPPTRISLTLPAIRTAKQVWIVTAGEEKADAVARAIAGASEVHLPVAGAQGDHATRWLIDRAAASKLPS